MSGEKAEMNVKEKLEAQIKSVDMTEEMQHESIEVAQEAMSKYSVEKDIAMHIKKTFDERKGPTWHCIDTAPYSYSKLNELVLKPIEPHRIRPGLTVQSGGRENVYYQEQMGYGDGLMTTLVMVY